MKTLTPKETSQAMENMDKEKQLQGIESALQSMDKIGSIIETLFEMNIPPPKKVTFLERLKKLFFPLCIATLVLQSCTIAKISGRGPVPLMLNQAEGMQYSEHISASRSISFDYTNAFDVSEVLSRELTNRKPDRLANVTVTIKTEPVNFLINLVTLGLANSRTVYIDADVMKNK